MGAVPSSADTRAATSAKSPPSRISWRTSPANFLDVGGGASKEQVTEAFKIILSDKNVKGILVNIFGGIMDCNVIATGIVEAVRETHLNLPLVVRLEGNNVASGRKTLQESGLTLITGDTMADAAKNVVQAVAA
jgi:succinyl-CoA synthetase beta subunit